MPRPWALGAQSYWAHAELIARLIAQEHTRLRALYMSLTAERKPRWLIRRRATIVRLKGTLKQTMRHLAGFAAELRAVVATGCLARQE